MFATRGIPVAAVAVLAACNQSQAGVNERILFTPVQCGQPLDGCDFDDSVGLHGTISLQISGIDGQPTAGLDLASRDPSVAQVSRRADISNAPAWDLAALAPGVVDVAAIDSNGIEIDFVQVGVQEVVGLTMVPVDTSIVGPDVEEGYDEAFTIKADLNASWLVRPLIAGDVTTMGRFAFTPVLDPLATQVQGSDPDNGLLAIKVPAGTYPVSFSLSADPAIAIEAVIHAQP
jgi:hypothetical protein